MDKSLYGKELAKYKLDYLGGHENIDAVLMNPDIIIYDKGIVISSSLNKNFIYLRWDKIESVVYYRESTEKIEIDYEEQKTVTLEKADESTDVMDMLLKIKSASPDTEILEKAEIHKNSKEESEEAFFPLDEQDLRIYARLGDIKENVMLEAYKKWKNYLSKTLRFPFEAEISEEQRGGSLQEGDKLTVLSIDSTDDLYGILVNIAKKKKRYVFPLCDLEVVDVKSENYLPVNDYSYWFTNYR
ncbi:hypothetical protein Dtox_2203 [Desulfofarcimen acetoxidans DSM 771]|uniref:Uncharacterized protein n=1 Tax=Desulfofarcimen acetoxidans (strain ATCC 49208 / DSM 771 / KCTC 5769 / VKM B-1644 / 5575) TaxID=485916 RepID=C8VZP3_DESAS|nr:calcium-binding protein [Desulfofarcimen acetoxidans]ACV63021.1 hypothetical protein Dtox_2203 [Desulfofarcimen acetoxidans DSM 771]